MTPARTSPRGAWRSRAVGSLSFSLTCCALVAAFAIAPAASTAATVYVDNTNAACSDLGPGTIDTPYCTISAAVAAHGVAGNTIHVLAGTYREQINVPASGASGSPITIETTHPAVVIDGADDFSSPAQWTPHGGDVWLAASVTWSPKQVFADGARLAAGAGDPALLPANSFLYVAGTGLYVNAGGGNPAGHAAAVGRRNYGFSLSGRSWVSILGFHITRAEDKGIYLAAGSDHCVLSGNRLTFHFKFGLQLTTSSFGLVADNFSADNGGHGLAFTVGSTGCTIERNESTRNVDPAIRQANGVYLFGAPGNVIAGNLLHHNQDSGLQIQSGSDGCLAVQNRSWGNGDHGYDNLLTTGTTHLGDVAWGNSNDGFSVEGSAIGTRLYNCIGVDNGLLSNEYDLFVDAGSIDGFVSDHNIFFNSTAQSPIKFNNVVYLTIAGYTAVAGQDAHSTQADPLFVDPTNGDFHLNAGSPAIDAANSGVTNWPATDAEGKPRFDDPSTPNTGAGPVPSADRGALEFADLRPIVTAPSAVKVDENSTLTVNVTAADPDGDPIASLTADLSGLPACDAVFTPDPGNGTGTLTWRPTFDDAGSYTVSFHGSNALSGSSSTIITVNNVDRPPVVLAPRRVRTTPCELVEFKVTAYDPDGDPIRSLTVNLSHLKRGHRATFVVDATNTSGVFTWTPRAVDLGKNKVVFIARNALKGRAVTHIRVRWFDKDEDGDDDKDDSNDLATMDGDDETDGYAFEEIARLQSKDVALAMAPEDAALATAPERLSLSSPFPNPGRGAISLALDLPESGAVEWSIYDIQGRELWGERLDLSAGRATLSWDGRTWEGRAARAGIYLVRVAAGGQVFTRRVMRL